MSPRNEDPAQRHQERERVPAQQRTSEVGRHEREQSRETRYLLNDRTVEHLDRDALLRVARGVAGQALRLEERHLVSGLCALRDVHSETALQGPGHGGPVQEGDPRVILL